mgnify:CR=1 FL=1
MKTTMSFTRRTGLALAAMACMLVQGQALAQTYPTKPIKFVVPFSAGSATDIVARTVADLHGHVLIEAQDMAEALQYRPTW